MNRSAGMMVLCLALGAAVMYGSSNFRLRVESVGVPEAKTPPPPAPWVEPGRLPDSLTRSQVAEPPRHDPQVRQAAGVDDIPSVGLDKVTEDIALTNPKTITWNAPTAGNPSIFLITRNPTLVFSGVTKAASVTIRPTGAGKKEVVLDTKTAPAITTPGIADTAADKLTINFEHPSLRDVTGSVIIRVFEKADSPNPLAVVGLRVPIRDPQQAPVIVAGVRNSPQAPELAVPLASSPLPLYAGSASFLQLRGQVFQSGANVRFVLQAGSRSVAEYASEAVVPQPVAPGWEYRLSNLPVFATTDTGVVAVRSEFGDSHFYAKEFIAFTPNRVVTQLESPKVTVWKTGSDGKATATAPGKVPGTSVYAHNERKLSLKIAPPVGAQAVLVYVDGALKDTKVLAPGETAAAEYEVAIQLPAAIKNLIRVVAVRGPVESESALNEVKVRTEGPMVEAVLAPGFGQSGGNGSEKIQIRFSADNPLDPASVKSVNFRVVHNESDTSPKRSAFKDAFTFDAPTNTVVLTLDKVSPGSYDVLIFNKNVTPTPTEGGGTQTTGITDVYGNDLVKAIGDGNVAYRCTLFTSQVDQPLPSQRAGVTLGTGPSVTFPEYVRFRVSPDGFNPSDRVEARVVRLYYFRDAHRVAQIVNRTVKSYNALTVDVRRRAADRGRDDADRTTDERKRLEGLAVRASQESRAAEAELTAAQNRAATSRVQAVQARDALGQLQFRLSQIQTDPARGAEAAQLRSDIATAQQAQNTAETINQQSPSEITRLQNNVASKREAEAKAMEAWQVKELQERRQRENQFRTEVSAATEDPDTYAPGDPNSNDPVLQVSVSVIGEGLIQLRGPIKGLNVIRTMVNQIDAPVGQVRVSVHTLQVNGERADRMEKVVANIQRHLDHSRFLTVQSSQMLRRAVTIVASRKALEAQSTIAPNATQWDRDQKYLYAFFGKDFTDELAQLDSEFLKTGNKLLSLNSMDSTSLSAGLFLMALAKNDVRSEIVNEFLGLVQRELPQWEWKYYIAGISDLKCCEACKDKKQYLLAYNSHFQSFLGFFTSETQVADTLTPFQREFIRLAQIFKARMITEMQLRQRVMERALLEERIGTVYLEELKKAKVLEDQAKAKLQEVQDKLIDASASATNALQSLLGLIERVETEFAIIDLVLDTNNKSRAGTTTVVKGQTVMIPTPEKRAINVPILDITYGYETIKLDDPKNKYLKDSLSELNDYLDQFVYLSQTNNAAYTAVSTELRKVLKENVLTLPLAPNVTVGLKTLRDLIARESGNVRAATSAILAGLRDQSPDAISKSISIYDDLRVGLLERLRRDSQIGIQMVEIFEKRMNPAFQRLGEAQSAYLAANAKAKLSRRPLDEKKLLDMMVDEMEDKFIEILEGTRAHTSNIDNYIKAVTTALDDDFNTQYYLPSFRRAREASRAWDVTLGQIETTTVLANNRTLAKVSPSATFEFDLPKRDILITEGFKSAKALMDTYGAMVNDPSFLSLAKMYSGNPVSMMTGGGGGLSAVRNVLPGLSTSPDERVMAQAGPGRKDPGSALDALIPDPAIYKFETGTGFEIRPVLSPDGQAVVFNFDYMYTTDVREPVRADEKHLGRVKRHFVHTDVTLSNFELREVSKYMVAIKVARTGKGVQLLQDIPGVGVLFRPLPSAGASLQQNLIYSQATIFPTLFDLMGLRYAPAVADIDPLADRMAEFAARYRRLDLEQRIYDIGATRVDDALRTPQGERRFDFYRPQVSLPYRHPNGYIGPGLRLKDGKLVEDFNPLDAYPPTQYSPGVAPETRPTPYNLTVPYNPPGYEIPPPTYIPGHGAVPTTPLMTKPALPQGGAVRPPAGGGSPFPANAPVNVGRPVPVTPYPPTGGVGAPRVQDIPGTYLPPVITPGTPGLGSPPPLPALPSGR